MDRIITLTFSPLRNGQYSLQMALANPPDAAPHEFMVQGLWAGLRAAIVQAAEAAAQPAPLVQLASPGQPLGSNGGFGRA